MNDAPPLLIAGATGYIGGELTRALVAADRPVRALARNPDRADLPPAVELARGDVISGAGLSDALDGVQTAYYLVHSMGRGSGPAEEFAARDREGAEHFGAAAAAAGVTRIVYLGGLEGGEHTDSAHLRSRGEVAQILAQHVPGTVHARAAMVIGPGSASFQMLTALVRRLPAMVCPSWVETRTQPIAIGDLVAALVALADLPDAPAEVQLGGADVITYRDMMSRVAAAMGRRAPLIVSVPLLTPRLSSYWVTLVTPVEHALVKPLVDGLSAEMLIDHEPPAGINEAPLGFDAAVRAALL